MGLTSGQVNIKWLVSGSFSRSVSKPSVNCNSLVKSAHVSEQNLDWPLAN